MDEINPCKIKTADMMIKEKQILQLIKLAAHAPSGHNTQPWRFSYDEGSITMRPDFMRALQVVDADNHAMFISLGCALENLLIAARQYGLEATYEITSESADPNIKVALREADEVAKSDLFDFILKRQVCRSVYLSEQLERNTLSTLIQLENEPGVSVKYFTKRADIETMIPYIVEGSTAQMQNRNFTNELVSWMRFNQKDALRAGDGIWFSSMGFPNVPRWLGKLIMLQLVSAKSEAKRWEKTIKQSAGLVLFMVEKNDIVHWIRIGQSFQRFGLTAALLNVCHAHVNMPCEEEAIRQRMAYELGFGDMTPLLLIRFGYADTMPYSFRRNLNEVIHSV